MDRIVNCIWLAWNLASIFRTYRTCNSTVGFSKYKLNNKLLVGVILLKVALGVTWTQPIYIYIYILYYLRVDFKFLGLEYSL